MQSVPTSGLRRDPGPSSEGVDEPQSIESLEQEITELTAHIHAATYRLLCLIREFDLREGWGGWGIRSCAHWLNWKCGIALCAAREKVRVAHAMADLPQISEAFRKGEVSYSKVRAMTRVATPENEEYLLMLARHGTASHIERVVRGCRQVRAIEALERVNERFAERYLTWYYDDDGSFVIKGRLPPEDGARVQKALEAALDEEDQRWWADVRERRDAVEKDVSAETSLPPGEHRSVPTWSENPFSNVLIQALQEREPVGARRADALLSMAETLLEHGPASGSGGDRYQIVVHIEAAGLEDPAIAGRSAIENGPALPGHTLRRLACDASVVRMLTDGEGQPLDVGRKTRTIPPAIRRALKTRDGGCRYPGCTALRFLDAHHVKHWADGGATRLSNLVQLCRFHHHLLHEGGFGMKVLDDGALVFTRPDGRRVDPAARGHPRDPPSAEALMRGNRECGLTIDATTGECLWLGERMHLSSAVEGVLYDSG